MSQTPNDPAGTTHQFQTFANQGQGQAAEKSGPNIGLIVGIVAVVAIVAVIVAGLLMI
ncbi:hypothetical protein [Actinomadura fibrosa]|uniref:DUF2970 domain-containing protein n=1 Tax=Actinomadura fibrosa TaxID=111802 RepID=A0ABW2XGG4_9ACTN|nr:hypothetical protein [Actinomadura fibrosa]